MISKTGLFQSFFVFIENGTIIAMPKREIIICIGKPVTRRRNKNRITRLLKNRKNIATKFDFVAIILFKTTTNCGRNKN